MPTDRDLPPVGPVPPGDAANRPLGLGSAAALVVASMVGAGLFTTSGHLLGSLGSPAWVLLAWVLGGGLAALGALCYGALARRLPESGGEYLFLTRTLHPAAGYIAGWVSLLAGFSAPMAVAAVAFGDYLDAWFPGFDPRVAGTLLMTAFCVLHALHVRRGARVQDIVVMVKLAAIGGVALVGAAHLGSPVGAGEAVLAAEGVAAAAGAEGALDGAGFSVGALGSALVMVYFSYCGYNAAVYVGGEVRDPQRNLPRALLLGTGLVTLVYVALNAVIVYAAPAEVLAGRTDVARAAAEALGGPAWGRGVAALIALALATSVSSLAMAGPRVYAQMARDGCAPAVFAQRGGEPPRVAVALQFLLAVGMLWTSTFDALLTYVGFTLGLSTAATVLGLLVLRGREGAAAVPVPGWPWVPALFLIGVLGITGSAVVSRPVESAAGVATLLIPLGLWSFQRRGAGAAAT